MAALTTLITTAALALGTGASIYGQVKQAAAASSANRAQKQQAALEAERRRREQIRNLMLARSQTLTSGVNSGAFFGSGVAGGLGSANSQTLSNIQGINQGQEIGAKLFSANTAMNTAQGISSLGGALISNAGQLGQIGGSLFQRSASPVQG